VLKFDLFALFLCFFEKKFAKNLHPPKSRRMFVRSKGNANNTQPNINIMEKQGFYIIVATNASKEEKVIESRRMRTRLLNHDNLGYPFDGIWLSKMYQTREAAEADMLKSKQ
jgi:G:T-mismatch repair DNA endonuclease (very short patch repair protein)